MSDCYVYRNGDVVLDGIKLKHVACVSPPEIQGELKGFGKVTLDITGSLIYSDIASAPPPAPIQIPADPIVAAYRELVERIEEIAWTPGSPGSRLLDGLPLAR